MQTIYVSNYSGMNSMRGLHTKPHKATECDSPNGDD